MKRIRRYIITILTMLLLLGGGNGNSAWAIKVTYHIITMPFNRYNNKNILDKNIRVEALVCYDDNATGESQVRLPDAFRSPLMNDTYTENGVEKKTYQYYKTVTGGSNGQVYGTNGTQYMRYTSSSEFSNPIEEGTTLSDAGITENIDIYVLYDYNKSKKVADTPAADAANITPVHPVSLDGSMRYNIQLDNYFYGGYLNKWGNRANCCDISKYSLSDIKSLSNQQYMEAGDGNPRNLMWFLQGNDPYHIRITTAYKGDRTDDTGKNRVEGAFLWAQMDYKGSTGKIWMSTDTVSNYKNMQRMFCAFAILKHPTAEGTNKFTLVGSNLNPTNRSRPHPTTETSDGYYCHLQYNSADEGPQINYVEKSTASVIQFWEVPEYEFRIKTPFYGTDGNANKSSHTASGKCIWSEYAIKNFPAHVVTTAEIPDSLDRKYCEYTNLYKDDAFEDSLSTYEEARTNGKLIWVDHVTTGLPFETLPVGGSYEDATWYTMRMNGHKETRYIAYYDESGGNNNGYFSTGLGSNDYLHYGDNTPNAYFAFMGDPYEMKIINRKASENDRANRYVGCDAGATANTSFDPTADPEIGAEPAVATTFPTYRWEIVADDVSGAMLFRKFGSTLTNPTYIGWKYEDQEHNRPMTYYSEGSYVRVVPLATKTYVYHIVNNAGTVAVKASEVQEYGVKLKYGTIPEIIRSPFLNFTGAKLKFYWSLSDATSDTDPSNPKDKDHGSYADASEYDIYVRYDLSGVSDERKSYIDGTTEHAQFNVRVNSQYIYYNNENINSKTDITDSESGTNPYLWILGGEDPYAMTIKNVEANKYVKANTEWADDAALDWNTEANASKFIIKAGTSPGVWEVMAATGEGVNASETYYHIGLPSANTVKMYSNSSYKHGYTQLAFQLTKKDAITVTYHLIDKTYDKDLLQVTSRHIGTDAPQIPAQYWSPLVKKYSYYTYSQFTVTNDVYTLNADQTELATVNGASSDVTKPGHIYITYEANDLIDMEQHTMYLLKFDMGDKFYQENGSDGRISDADYADAYKSQAVYPYCNGDCNMNIYGQYQYDVQQEGAASTRTRWAWYVLSAENDPYHVKILSRQTETYDGMERHAYFSTVKPDDYEKVVTTLVWPSISGQLATDYMVLGGVGHYQLVTSYPITIGETSERHAVTSLEQYWKTYDTVKKKLLSDLLSDCEERERTDRTDGSIEVPEYPTSLRERLTGTGTGQYGFHSYDKMAYAKRWNGYNKAGEKKKGWETREHWFQTVQMGEGYFNFVETTIDPALILLDQHGWEIMRKPIPSSPDDPKKAEKYEALAAYDSPMVKEYLFWSSAKKRSGFHQYYLMDKRIGDDFTSTTLTSLPPYGSTNVLDSKGNLNDQYVTYIVKDEYAQAYVPGTTPTAYPFLIQQGDNLAKNNGTATIAKVDIADKGASQYIIENINYLTTIGSKKNELWYLKPNTNIDTEMGYTSSNHNWGDTNPNAYEDDTYSTYQVAQVIEGSSSDATIKKYGRFTFSNGFDPYNIQISSNSEASAKYFTLGLTGSEVNEGIYQGTYGSKNVTLATQNSSPVNGTGHDQSVLKMTNQTLMAVQDADGNMQLVPRFDHTLRVRNFSTLVTPTDDSEDADKLKETYTQLYRPYVYNYRIIDNEGREALRYQSGGELRPFIADHLKSPLATNFGFYKTLSGGVCTDTISASLAGAGLTAGGPVSNLVYVRYDYNEDADLHHTLYGKWLTMKLNEKDVQYTTVGENEGIYADASPATKPATIDNDAKTWQWKFLKNPYSDPDPYAVQIFNRNQKDKPMQCSVLIGTQKVTATSGTDNYQRFVLLSHEEGGYALAVAGTESYTDYYFLNGSSITESVAATLGEEDDFTSTKGSFTDKKSQVVLTDEVDNTYTYKVYTHNTAYPNDISKYGTEAISGNQLSSEAENNKYVPTVPDAIMSPMLNKDDFVYYEALTDIGISDRQLENLYGLYEGEVYVRYSYDPNKSQYKVPNERNATDAGDVAAGANSNEGPLRFGEKMLYNIIWYEDAMMKSDADYSGITSIDNQPLTNDNFSVWQFLGDDPYAMKIKIAAETKYLHEATSNTCNLDPTPTTFMLLKKNDYDYGVLQKTGATTKLTTHGSALTADTEAAPDEFIIFALSTLKVIYHLVIANIGNNQEIPWRDYISKANAGAIETWNNTDGGYTTAWTSSNKMTVNGTTKRDLTTAESGVAGDKYQLGSTLDYPNLEGTLANTTYCYNKGPISLGDTLIVPDVFHRPNVNYNFIVHNIFNGDDTENSSLNQLYKGLELKSKKMSLNQDMIGKIIYIDVVYGFNTDLTETNAGNNFVLSINENKWYTVETVIDDTPWLAQYTNAWGFELKEGRGSHYTNDFLWTPIGDPYGFQLYNRYTDRNSGATNTGDKNMVINSYFADGDMDAFKEGKRLTMSDDGTDVDDNAKYSVYELLADENTTAGYFHFHPVVNNEGTQYYFNPIWGNDDGDETNNLLVRLSATAAEFTFGLSTELVEPYYTRAGYVGGLTANGKQLYEEADGDLMKMQAVVYNDANIVQFNTGYYRMHSPLGVSDISPVRYASGYTHKSELTGGENGEAIPMHFYELDSEQKRTFTDLNTGFTHSVATRGDITILPVAQDPASIFYCEEDAETANVGYMSAEGLYLKGEKGKGETNEDNRESASEQAKAVMDANKANASELFVMDIGGAILLIHDNTSPQYRKYLSYDARKSDDYDLKLTHNTHTDLAKWCMQPVQKTATAGTNEMGLTLALHNGGDGYYYSSFYAPFDVLLSDATNDLAFICKIWNEEMVHLKKVGKYNTTDNGCPSAYAGSNQFVPGGTPVIIRSTNATVTLALPTTVSSTTLATYFSGTVNNIFEGEYLEQLLEEEATGTDEANNDVYVFGVPYGGTFTKDDGYYNSGENNGVIHARLPESGDTNVGFYINATPNREVGLAMGEWVRNNRYVYNNRIYYRSSGSGSSPQRTQEAAFIPVSFDDDDEPIEESIKSKINYDQVYDLSGRCVASGLEVQDGSWRQHVAPGIYILGDKKVVVRRKP